MPWNREAGPALQTAPLPRVIAAIVVGWGLNPDGRAPLSRHSASLTCMLAIPHAISVLDPCSGHRIWSELGRRARQAGPGPRGGQHPACTILRPPGPRPVAPLSLLLPLDTMTHSPFCPEQIPMGTSVFPLTGPGAAPGPQHHTQPSVTSENVPGSGFASGPRQVQSSPGSL